MTGISLLDYYKTIERELASLFSVDEIKSLQRIIIEKKLNIPYHQVFINQSENIDSKKFHSLLEIINQLKTGKPIQYILGETEFCGLRIKLTQDVLIPRPETEELVDLLLKSGFVDQPKILDIGTGSGCIAIALAKNLPKSTVIGVDISENALMVARENALLNKVNVIFKQVNILDMEDKIFDSPFDLIVSNPPYVMKSEAKLMKSNVLDFEPHLALFVDDDDPLLFYRVIAIKAKVLLKKNGRLAMEINEALGSEIQELFSNLKFEGIVVHKDINGKNRFLTAVHG